MWRPDPGWGDWHITTSFSAASADCCQPVGQCGAVRNSRVLQLNNSTLSGITGTTQAGALYSDIDLVASNYNGFISSGCHLIGSGNALAGFDQPGDLTNQVSLLAPLVDEDGDGIDDRLEPADDLVVGEDDGALG